MPSGSSSPARGWTSDVLASLLAARLQLPALVLFVELGC
jgi:hypothetical protein